MTVFFDVDTQLDFVSPGGALYVPGAEKRISTIARLNRKAPRLLSSVDAHSENDLEFRTWPPHCVLGTFGQRKPAELIVPNQILFPKTTTDAFQNPALRLLLGELGADHYVVYGVVSEICVRFVALGLLELGKNVDVVTDAIEALNQTAEAAFLAQFTGRGGRLVASSSYL